MATRYATLAYRVDALLSLRPLITTAETVIDCADRLVALLNHRLRNTWRDRNAGAPTVRDTVTVPRQPVKVTGE